MKKNKLILGDLGMGKSFYVERGIQLERNNVIVFQPFREYNDLQNNKNFESVDASENTIEDIKFRTDKPKFISCLVDYGTQPEIDKLLEKIHTLNKYEWEVVIEESSQLSNEVIESVLTYVNKTDSLSITIVSQDSRELFEVENPDKSLFNELIVFNVREDTAGTISKQIGSSILGNFEEVKAAICSMPPYECIVIQRNTSIEENTKYEVEKI